MAVAIFRGAAATVRGAMFFPQDTAHWSYSRTPGTSPKVDEQRDAPRAAA